MTDGMGLSNFINEIINENKDFERFENIGNLNKF